MPRTCKFAFYTVRFAVFLVHLSTDTIFQKSLKKKTQVLRFHNLLPSSWFLPEKMFQEQDLNLSSSTERDTASLMGDF